MSEKMSTIILKVDLQCSLCYKKIKKTLCKLQDRGKIVYDEKNDKVTISGPFDPKKLIKKICYNACKVIKDIEIVQDKPKPVDPPPEEAKPEPELKPAAPAPEPELKPAAPAPNPPPPAPEPVPEPAPAPPEPEPTAPEPEQVPTPAPKPTPTTAPAPEPEPAPAPAPEPEPAPAPELEPAPAPAPAPKPEPVPAPEILEPQKVEPEPLKSEPEPVSVYSYSEPVCRPDPGPGPICCCRPWFEAYYGGCRCCSCGCVYGPPPVVYGEPCYDGRKTYEFICEEDPSCSIM